jgi:hypothetical protein
MHQDIASNSTSTIFLGHLELHSSFLCHVGRRDDHQVHHRCHRRHVIHFADRPYLHYDVAGHQRHSCRHRDALRHDGYRHPRHRSSQDRLACCRHSYWIRFVGTVVAAAGSHLIAEEHIDVAVAGSHLALEGVRGCGWGFGGLCARICLPACVRGP